mgnify:CR=1 FL=1
MNDIICFHFSVFTVDRNPPITTISSHPDRYTNQKTVQFRWIGQDIQTQTEDLMYSFHINSEPWSPYTHETSKVFYLKKDGDYTFTVRSKDNFGNVEESPPTYIFTLDTVPPVLEIYPLPRITTNKQITINGKSEFGCNLLINNVQQQIDANGSFEKIIELRLGINNIHISSTDQTGNVSAIEYSITRESFTPVLIKLQIGNLNATVKNNKVLLDCAPFTENGRTMVPLRFIAESFGAKVDWFPETQSIEILFPQSTNSLRAYYLQSWIQNHFENVLHLFDGRN